ncbi:MAG: peptidoglycan-binding domain-containing protein [Gammaproteobacteria bacterium]
MQLSKLNVLLRATVALCAILLIALPVLGQPSGDPRIREAQTLLAEQKYSPGPVDGILGPRTLSAILRFQIDRGLPPTRELDNVTLETLRADAINRQGEPSSNEPAAGSVPTTSPGARMESRDTPAEPGVGGIDTVEDADSTGLGETEAIPGGGDTALENGTQTLATTPLPETEMPAAQHLSQGDNPAAAGAGEQAEETLPDTAAPPSEPWFKSVLSFLPSEFNVENALFIGLLVFAAVAVVAAIYTSIRGRERKDTEQHSEADEETVFSSAAEEDPEATVIGPIEPRVTTPPQATVTPSAEANRASPTELVSSDTEATSPEEVTRAVRAELFPESEPRPKSQTAEPNEPVRDEQPQEDPLADLNVYLAFERFDQAEGLVKDAIERYPQRHEYLLRLLEVYTAAKNPLAFEFYARALRDAVGDKSPLMTAAFRWWDTISPERRLFEAPLEEETRRL